MIMYHVNGWLAGMPSYDDVGIILLSNATRYIWRNQWTRQCAAASPSYHIQSPRQSRASLKATIILVYQDT